MKAVEDLVRGHTAAWTTGTTDRIVTRCKALYDATVDAVLPEVLKRHVSAALTDLVKTYLASLKLPR